MRNSKKWSYVSYVVPALFVCCLLVTACMGPAPGPDEQQPPVVAAVDKDELQGLYNQYGAIDPDKYTGDAAEALRAALAETVRVLNDPDATQEEVDAAVESLRSALIAVSQADKGRLQSLYDQYGAIYLDEYTDDSANALRAALAAAERALYKPDADQAEVDAAAAALEAAKNALVKKDNGAGADKDALRSLFVQCSAIDPDEYTDDSADALIAALAAAERVLNNPDAAQSEVDAAATALGSAFDSLVSKTGPRADKDRLQSLFDQYSAIDPDKYTGDTAEAFRTALAEAERVLYKRDAAQQEVDVAAAALERAFNALELVPPPQADKEKLQWLYNRYGTIDPNKYSNVAGMLRSALDEAGRVLNDTYANQEEVDAAVEGLKSVLKEIVVYDTSYNPVYFNPSTLTNTIRHLGDGVRLIKHRYKRSSNSNNIEINMVEVDLEKATIAIGIDYSSKPAPPGTPKVTARATLTHMNNWNAAHPGRRVMAATNGGYFNMSTGQPIGSLVDNGYIVNDNDNVWCVSANTLFGVKGDKGQMGPMKRYTGSITDPKPNGSTWYDVVYKKLTYAQDGSIQSFDGLWDGYTTIAGGVEALIIDGAIPHTVALESTNGAASHNQDSITMPRTAMGLIGDHTAVLISIECIAYGGTNNANDPKGMPLRQMADFFRYYGLSQAANFDGGGSVIMIYNDGYNGNGTNRLQVRSSTSGSSWTTMTGSTIRSVAYSLMAVTK